MRAVVFEPDSTLLLRELPSPVATGECVIRVSAAGICGTDLELLRGYAGFSGVPGHEFVGVVEKAPPGDARWIGRRVAGELTVGCGECFGCRAAGRGHCDAPTVLGINGRDVCAFDCTPADIAAFWRRFRDFVAGWQDPAAPFVARLRPGRITFPGDYDHLARLGEWSDGDDPEAGGNW